MGAWLLAAAIAVNVGASAADLVTTHQAIQSGRGVEANPFAHRGVKVGVTVGLNAASIQLWRKGRRRQALLVTLVPAGAWGAAAVWNHRVGR